MASSPLTRRLTSLISLANAGTRKGPKSRFRGDVRLRCRGERPKTAFPSGPALLKDWPTSCGPSTSCGGAKSGGAIDISLRTRQLPESTATAPSRRHHTCPIAASTNNNAYVLGAYRGHSGPSVTMSPLCAAPRYPSCSPVRTGNDTHKPQTVPAETPSTAQPVFVYLGQLSTQATVAAASPSRWVGGGHGP